MDLKEKNNQSQLEMMEDLKIPKYRKGDIVEGEVIEVKPNRILIDLGTVTEGKMYLDKFTKKKVNSFHDLDVKVGDVIRSEIQHMTQEEPVQILLSRLSLLDDERYLELRAALESGDKITAKIKTVNNGGMVLDYHGKEIFIPRSLLDNELHKSGDELKGQDLELIILEMKEDRRTRRSRIIGTRKPIFEAERQKAYEERQANREEELDKISTGDVLTGEIIKIEKHAVTVKFDYVTGLLRISQVSHHRIDDLSEHFKLDQEVTVKVIKKEGNRLDLSMKALIPTPYEEYIAEHTVGEDVTGTVFQKLPSGLIVELEPGVRGFLYKNEYSWNPNDNFDAYVKIGDELNLRIIQIVPEKTRISLSKKLLEDNPWRLIDLRRGDKVDAVIKEIEPEMIHLEVLGVDAFMKVDELGLEKGKAEDYYAVGDKLEVVVLNADKRTWTLEVSKKMLTEMIQKEAVQQHLDQQAEEEKAEENLTIGDLYNEELEK